MAPQAAKQDVTEQDVTEQDSTKQDSTKQDVAAAPKVTRRSYSYEPSIQPAPRGRSYNRSAAPTKDKWLYPKSDPRRYNH